MKKIIPALIMISFFSASSFAATSKMTTFLKSCAYGTLAGAVLGLGSLAISENPGGKMSNVARGASLGLYAGIGYGFYVNSRKSEPITDVEIGASVLYFQPLAVDHKLEGAQVNWIPVSF